MTITQPAPPPAPAANHTGGIRRLARAAVAAASWAAAWAAGHWGLGPVVGVAALAVIPAGLTAGLIHEWRNQRRTEP